MILVTGSTGNVGREVVRELHARGAQFKCLVRNPDKAAVLEGAGVATVTADMDDPASLEPALAGIETLFLLAAPSSRLMLQELNTVLAAKRAGVRRLVKISVILADRASAATFMRDHGRVEHAIESAGIPATFIRPTGFMQNLAPSFGGAVANGYPIYAPAGDARVSWVDLRDVAAVAATVLTQDGHEQRVYELTGGEAFSYADIAALLSGLLGRKVEYGNVTDAAAEQAFRGVGADPWLAHALVSLYQSYRQGHFAAVNGNIERLTGQPPRTLDAYLRENLQAFAAR
ncbi:MAG: SDR family oxidoreductase [Gammaproteobacteria bacterium]|nr:SDR family oxidoreductase [Gammaproteobacteria bacterium]